MCTYTGGKEIKQTPRAVLQVPTMLSVYELADSAAVARLYLVTNLEVGGAVPRLLSVLKMSALMSRTAFSGMV